MRCLVLALILGAWPCAASAQADPLQLGGNVRLRYEAVADPFRPGAADRDDFVTIRTDLVAQYGSGPLRIATELIDSRAYDTGPRSGVGTADVNALELVRASVRLEIGDSIGTGSATALEAGRFTLELGSRRFVGRKNNVVNSFTGARLDLGDPEARLTLFLTMPHIVEPADRAGILDNDVEWDDAGSSLTFAGAFLALRDAAGLGALDLFLLSLDEEDEPKRATRNRHIVTPGLRFYRDPALGRWDYELEGAYQFGHARADTLPAAARADVSAYFLHAEIGRRFAGPWSPRISIEYDLASGDGPGRGIGRLDPLYGARRGDLGPTGIFGPLSRSNLSSPAIRVEAAPGARWDGTFSYRPAWLESRTDAFASTGVRDPSGSSGRFAGHQIEGRARYWAVPDRLRLELGGAALFAGSSFLERAPNARGGTTRYVYGDMTLSF